MILVSVLFEYLICVFESYCCFKFMKSHLVEKEGVKEYISIILLSMVVVMKIPLINLGVSRFIATSGVIIVTFLFVHIIFDGSIKHKISSILVFFTFVAITESLVIGGVLFFLNISIDQLDNIGAFRVYSVVASKMLLFLTVQFYSVYRLKINNIESEDSTSNEIILLLSIINIIAFFVLIPFVEIISIQESMSERASVYLIAYAVISVLIVVLYERIVKLKDIEYRLNVENRLLSEQTVFYQKFDDMIHHLQSMKHDYDKHLRLLSVLIEENDISKSQAYLSELLNESNFDIGVVFMNSPSLSYLFGYYERLAYKKGIVINTIHEMDEAIVINDIDLAIIVGNLFENAIYASERSGIENPCIQVKIKMEKSILMFSFSNPYQGDIKKNGRVFMSAKRGFQSRGVGLANVIRAVEKYQGTMKVDSKDMQFSVSLIMMNEKVV